MRRLAANCRIFLGQPRFHPLQLLIALSLGGTLDSKAPPAQILSYCPIGHSNPIFHFDQFFDAVPRPHAAFQFELSRIMIYQHGYHLMLLFRVQRPLFPCFGQA